MKPGAKNTLMCWHAANAGIKVLDGALKCLAERQIYIDHVLYLVQAGMEGDLPASMPGIALEVMPIALADPTKHADIYQKIRQQVLPRLGDLPGALHLNISPGTPAMHSVWLILHAGGAFPAETKLWSSQFDPKAKLTRIDAVDFRLTTYLSEVRRIQQETPELAGYELEAKSVARRDAFEKLRRYASVAGAPLLILGERGTGKTRLVEKMINTLKGRPRVEAVACGGLDSELAESALFGHEVGAFTGAKKMRIGHIAKANGGILFLDEVQDLPQTMQRKLVRVLQDHAHKFNPLGSENEESSDFELVCASNLSIEELRNRLDADLFDRICRLAICIPPLRECREDLRDDWAHVWREWRRGNDLPIHAPWSTQLEDALMQSALPGNLRDLERLAVLLMAWWPGRNQDECIQAALVEWQHWDVAKTSVNLEFGQGTRKERIAQFSARLATWARVQYGTWAKAAKELGCNEKTLRGDVQGDK